MIVELTVENLAIIERADLRLGPGFTALTGETGAGKSLLIDAINLALGERSDSDLVRAGATKAGVSVVLDLSAQPEARLRCEELGVPLEENRLFIRRDVAAKGGSQCRLGGRPFPVAVLRQLGDLLVDLHGQHDHQSLMNPESHVGFLDDWIGTPARRLLADVEASYSRVESARKRLSQFRAGMRDREQRLDLLRFQIQEIETASPIPGETEELEASLLRLNHAEKLANAAYAALEVLEDRENCALDLLATSIKHIDGAIRFDTSLDAIAGPMESALVELQEAARAIRAYADSLEADPGRLDDVQARLDILKRLRRKYGADEAAVLAHLEVAQQELALIEEGEAGEEALVEALHTATEELTAHAQALSTLRRERALEFASLVQEQLRDLAMERAIFGVDQQAKSPDIDGADLIEFHFSANAGEPARPLSRIASGGEISRVMLAIKSALAGRAGVPTLIFDEVDVGLGGRAAATMARKLEELATHYQVLVISHLPQIASRAAVHFRIEKVEIEGRVVTQVRELVGDERIEEIARMLAGEHITDSALANARELLRL